MMLTQPWSHVAASGGGLERDGIPGSSRAGTNAANAATYGPKAAPPARRSSQRRAGGAEPSRNPGLLQARLTWGADGAASPLYLVQCFYII